MSKAVEQKWREVFRTRYGKFQNDVDYVISSRQGVIYAIRKTGYGVLRLGVEETAVPKRYVKFQSVELTGRNGAQKDCVPFAFAQAFEMPYSQVRDCMSREGGYSQKGGTVTAYWQMCVKEAGCKQVLGVSRVSQIPQKGKFLVWVRRHLTFVVDGVERAQWYSLRTNRKVYGMWEVE
jgi:hypothetical protein